MQACSTPAWVQSLKAGDLQVLGLEGDPVEVVTAMATTDGVDLDNVERCLSLLKKQPVIVHAGLPVALAAYWPAQRCFSASFDGAPDTDLATMTEAQAGLWLATVASELGPLPESPDHWYALTATGQTLTGMNHTAISAHLALQGHLAQPTEVDQCEPGIDVTVSRAFWTLVARCKDGR